MLYVIHGEEEFLRSQAVKKLRERLGSPPLSDMNFTQLEGKKVKPEELKEACYALPFMLPTRMVLVRGLLSRVERGNQELVHFLREFLPRLPPTTILVLEEEKTVGEEHPLYPLLSELEKSGRAKLLNFERIRGEKLKQWLRDRAREKGVEITPEAAEELAFFVGEDLRILDTELDKLAIYVDRARPIVPEDVKAVVPYAREASIFSLTDALGRKDAGAALEVLRSLLDQGEPMVGIIGMLGKHLRLLLMVKLLMARGYSSREIALRLRVLPFVVDKAIRQCGNFSVEYLKRAYERLLEVDVALKTGRAEGPVSLELLITALTSSME